MSKMPSCPICGSEKVIKNGSIHNGKPKFSCKECRRQFVENPSNKIIPKETWDIVDKLLVEKISAAGISRVTGISEVWIQKYINKKYGNVPRKSMAVLKKAV
jgi:insertion element IS1 protein InsB